MHEQRRNTSRTPGRGQRFASPIGTSLFIILRASDIALQYFLLKRTVFLRLDGDLRGNNNQLSTAIGSKTFSLPNDRVAILLFSVAAFLKHVYWVLVTNQEPMYASPAIIISTVNWIVSTLHTAAFSFASTNSFYRLPSDIYIGWGIAVLGLSIDVWSETERRIFKDRNRNHRVVYTQGLFRYARHINYTGFIIWRAGQAWAAGGLLWGLFWGGLFTVDFLTAGIPDLEDYMSTKYGKQWEVAKHQVRYLLLPGVL